MTDQRVQDHQVVSFTYVIRGEDGTVLEQSDAPISYVHGLDDSLFPQLTQALEGKRVGEVVDVTLSPEEGFGQPNPDLMVTDDIDNVPPEFHRVGAEAVFNDEAGETLTMTVTQVDDQSVTLDGNHPFAGKTLRYKLTITEVRPATVEEIGNGHALAQGAGGMMH